jgi:hypothetical protein
MHVPVDLPNSDSALYPEMYATVALYLSSDDKARQIAGDARDYSSRQTNNAYARNLLRQILPPNHDHTDESQHLGAIENGFSRWRD